jgi:hypothetical protein
MSELFLLSTDETPEDGWFLCFGRDHDGKEFSIVTNNIHGSDAQFYLRGAKLDAETVLRILNDHYEDYIK